MFEFDEHYDELEAMEADLTFFQTQGQNMLPAWTYVGDDVWKLGFDVDAFETSQAWHLEAEDVA